MQQQSTASILSVPVSICNGHCLPSACYQDFGEHGREYISAELGIRLLRTLTNPAEIKAVLGGGERGAKLYEMLKNVVFVVSGKGCQRQPGCEGHAIEINRGIVRATPVCLWYQSFASDQVCGSDEPASRSV